MLSRPANQVRNGILTSIIGARGFQAVCNQALQPCWAKIDVAGFTHLGLLQTIQPLIQSRPYVDQVK